MIKKFCYKQYGFALLETAIALPIIVMLLSVLSAMTWWAFRTYHRELADINAQEELQLSMERILIDISSAETIQIHESAQKRDMIVIEMHREPTQMVNSFFVRHRATYDARLTSDGLYRRLVGDGDEPITGNGFIGETDVVEFTLRENPGGKKMLRLNLAIKSVVTGHIYRLSTEIFLPHARIFVY